MSLLTPLRIGVYAFVVLIISFAVLSGAAAMARAVGDEAVATFLSRAALIAVLLFAVDMIALLGILAIRTLQEHDVDRDQ